MCFASLEFDFLYVFGSLFFFFINIFLRILLISFSSSLVTFCFDSLNDKSLQNYFIARRRQRGCNWRWSFGGTHRRECFFFFFCTFVRIASNGCSDWNSSWSQAANFYKMRTLWMQCALWIQFRHTVVATTTTDWNHILCIMNFTFVAMSAMFPWRYFCIAWYDISAVFVKHIFPTKWLREQ